MALLTTKQAAKLLKVRPKQPFCLLKKGLPAAYVVGAERHAVLAENGVFLIEELQAALHSSGGAPRATAFRRAPGGLDRIGELEVS